MARVRAFWVAVHRYVGLFMAGFLVIIGLTGSIIVFNPELNAWLNPLPSVAPRETAALSPLALRRIAAELVPQGVVNTVNLHPKDGQPYVAYVDPRVDPATGRPFPLDFAILYLDPYSGQELGRDRSSAGLWPITSSNVMTLINRLHYQLAIPGNFGTYLFGVVALLWTLDCLVAAYLTFPPAHRKGVPGRAASRRWLGRWWRPAWLVRRDASFFRLWFDLHRAGGLWLWLLLLAFAWSSVGFNLGEQVYVPVMRTMFGMPDVYGNALPNHDRPSPDPGLAWDRAYETAHRLLEQQSQEHGFEVEYEDWFVFLPDKAVFLYAVRTNRDLNREGGSTILIFDEGGRLVSSYLPTGSNVGGTINSWIFALHTAKIGGMPYRLFVVAFGGFVALLAVTGVYIWWKKRRAAAAGSGPSPNPAAGRGSISR